MIAWLLAATLVNPYLAEFSRLPSSFKHHADDKLINSDSPVYRSDAERETRLRLVHRYSWAVPTTQAISAISSRCPKVIDFGAGVGYWSHLLSQSGSAVRAADDWSWWKDQKPELWFNVEDGNVGWLDQFNDSWCLLMVWPPDGPMAEDALDRWHGDTFIYVGEWQRCCATGWFFSRLVMDFYVEEVVSIPQWWNRTDYVYVFKRRRPSG